MDTPHLCFNEQQVYIFPDCFEWKALQLVHFGTGIYPG